MTAADLAKKLSPAMAAALQAAARGDLIRSDRLSPAITWIMGGSKVTSRTIAALLDRQLIRLGEQCGPFTRHWEPTDLGAEVLAQMAGQDGPR